MCSNTAFALGNAMIMPLIAVYDGDTVKSVITLPAPLNIISIRINGIDAPETTQRAKCEKEQRLGIEASDYLKDLLKNVKLLYVTNYKYGKFAGRILGDVGVYVDDKFIDLKTLMLDKGYAKPYNGKQKPNWCQ